MTAALITLLIVAGYALSVWWLLRRETTAALAGVIAICGVALALRLVYTTDYPPGLVEDEPKALRCAERNLRIGWWFGEVCTGPPALLIALFQAQFVPVVGPNRWAMRGYSLATSVVSPAVAFGAARAMGLGAGASLAAGSFVAVLPWAVFFGRISLGGEIVFHQLLLLAALAGLIWRDGGWRDVCIGALGLALLMYDYAPARAMVGVPLVAAVVARGWRRRALCLAVLVLAMLAWQPYLRAGSRDAFIGMSAEGFHPDLRAHLWEVLGKKFIDALHSLVAPVGMNGWYTVSAAAMHPWALLGLAAVGWLTGVRRAVFLLAGFLGGLSPAVVSLGAYPSAHRMMTAFPFLSLAAACALEAIPGRWLRASVTVAAVGVIALESVRLFFSGQFWSPDSRGRFDTERTALVEAIPLPPHPRLVLDPQIGFFWHSRWIVDNDWRLLDAENWWPPDGVESLYAFTQHAAALRPFYEQLLGVSRLQVFDRAFLVRFESGDWSWMSRHGWLYAARCREEVKYGQVPVLFQAGWSLPGFSCSEPAEHLWWGRWLGQRARMRLRFSGKGEVRVADQAPIASEGFEAGLEFDVEPGADMRISVTVPRGVFFFATLWESTPAGDMLPIWERVAPTSYPSPHAPRSSP